MAHESQVRYASLVDAKLRYTLIKKDGVFFNTRYQGSPKAGSVKIPVRDTEVSIQAYDKANGVEGTNGSTSYLTMLIDKDYAVNEIIDGFDAVSVPDNLVADRLDSAGYSMALQQEQDATDCLEAAATVFGDTTELTTLTVYDTIVDIRKAMTKAKVPNDGKRWLDLSPDVYALVLKDKDHFVKASDLGDAVVQTGAVGKIAGFLVFEDATLSNTTEIIAGHPNWCHHVNEWAVGVHVQDISGSGKYIGASAVQGRNVYGYKVSKPETLFIKKRAVASEDATQDDGE
ncbi:MAG: hypothetical protein LUE11_06800 [Clostridia bacterium]|nr:hypothetical protein [Clostridia bacterium]